MKYWTLLLVMVLVLGACTQPAGIGADGTTSKEDTVADVDVQVESNTTAKPRKNVTRHNVTKEIEEEDPEDEEDYEGADRIDITRKSDGTGFIEGTVNGVTKSQTQDYDDQDALIFDAAQLFGLELLEARYITWVDGKRYYKPSELVDITEAVSLAEDPNLDTSGIAYHETFDEGFIRGIGCDRERGILTLKIANERAEDVPLWRDVKPRIRGALVVRLNKAVMANLYCEGEDILKAGEEYKCRKSGILFVEDKQGAVGEVDYSKFQNELVAQVPGDTQIKKFSCFSAEDMPEVNATEGNVSSNSTGNETA